jgi:hypothetical protein
VTKRRKSRKLMRMTAMVCEGSARLSTGEVNREKAITKLEELFEKHWLTRKSISIFCCSW